MKQDSELEKRVEELEKRVSELSEYWFAFKAANAQCSFPKADEKKN